MPPYTSLWLHTLLEIKGTAAWLRTGEASPAAERGQGAREGPRPESEGSRRGGVRGTPPLWGPRGCSWRWMDGSWAVASSLRRGPCSPIDPHQGHSLPQSGQCGRGPAVASMDSPPGPTSGQALDPRRPVRSSEPCGIQKGNRGPWRSHAQSVGRTWMWSVEKCPPKDVHFPTLGTRVHVTFHGKRALR